MFKEIKKKTRSRKIFFAFIWGAFFLIFISVFGGVVSDFVEPSYNLNDLDEFDLKPGMKVEVDVQAVFDCYCYEEVTYSSSDGTSDDTSRISSKQYYIPFQDKIIGMKCSNSYDIEKVDENLEKMYEYYEGNDDALEQLATISLKGYIRDFDSESLDYYNAGKEWFGSEYSDRFLPYRFEVRMHTSLLEIVIFGIITMALFIPFVYCVVQAIWPPLPKEIKEYFKKVGDEETARNQLEDFYKNSQVIHDVHYSPDMIYVNRNGKIVLAETKDLLWIYKHSHRWSVNFIPIVWLYSIKIFLQDKRHLSFSVGSEKAADDIISTFYASMPYLYYGYTDQIKNLFYNNYKAMVDAKESCRVRFLEAKQKEEEKQKEEANREEALERRKQQTIYTGKMN